MSFSDEFSGAVRAIRAGVQVSFPHIDQQLGTSTPHFDGTVKDFLESVEVDARAKSVLSEQLKNTVKKCPSCGKANAYLLPVCNSCGHDISNVEVSFVDNIFTSFIFGIARGNFPYSISVRQQTPQLLVFDDLMACSPCHVNCIPTNVYIPDLRVLFEKPEAGLPLVRKLVEIGWKTIEEQFLSNVEWRAKFLKGGDAADFDIESIRPHVIMGMNFPPSQYQLHLQVILPPFMPVHWDMFKKGVHFTKGRFVPVEFILPALELQQPVPDAANKPLEAVFDVAKAHGVDYDALHDSCLSRYEASHLALANFRAEDFGTLVVDGKDLATKAPAAGIFKTDSMALSSYGCPHVDGKYTRQYYKFAADTPVPLPTL